MSFSLSSRRIIPSTHPGILSGPGTIFFLHIFSIARASSSSSIGGMAGSIVVGQGSLLLRAWEESTDADDENAIFSKFCSSMISVTGKILTRSLPRTTRKGSYGLDPGLEC